MVPRALMFRLHASLFAAVLAVVVLERGAIVEAGIEAAAHINVLTAADIPGDPTSAAEACEHVALAPAAFCSMVDYPAVVASTAAQQDRDAATMFKFFKEYLGRYNCNMPYSVLVGCDDCEDAYRPAPSTVALVIVMVAIADALAAVPTLLSRPPPPACILRPAAAGRRRRRRLAGRPAGRRPARP